MNLRPILNEILLEYVLPWDGDHGIAHWARVLENGLRLASETGADVEVVTLFAVLHDSQRRNEMTDPQHGPRAAEFAKSLRGTLLSLEDHQFHLLYRACEGHTHERDHPDVTIQTCWDSDRLDLGRVGITPIPADCVRLLRSVPRPFAGPTPEPVLDSSQTSSPPIGELKSPSQTHAASKQSQQGSCAFILLRGTLSDLDPYRDRRDA